MAIYNLAGHNNNDSGAVANGMQENELTKDLRTQVNKGIDTTKYRLINDNDNDSLATMLKKLKSGNNSVCVEWHFDSADNKEAKGTTAFIKENADEKTKQFATEITETIARTLNTTNRGVKTPKDSARKKLAMPEMQGITALIEIEFITNKEAMEIYKNNKTILAQKLAKIMMKYDDMRK